MKRRIKIALATIAIVLVTATSAAAYTWAVGVSRHYTFWDGAYCYQYSHHDASYDSLRFPHWEYVDVHEKRLACVGHNGYYFTGWHT